MFVARAGLDLERDKRPTALPKAKSAVEHWNRFLSATNS
jgi:hypothetical protein